MATTDKEKFFPKITRETLISQSIIANQIALNMNTLIVSEPQYYKQNFKALMKPVISKLQSELIKAEAKEYDKFDDMARTATDALYYSGEKMVKEIASLGIFHFENIHEILLAYKEDPKSIQGIVNKINRTK